MLFHWTVIKRPKKDPKQFVATEGAYFRIPCDESKSFPPARFSWKLKKDTADPGEEVRPDGRVSVAGDGTYNTGDPGEEVRPHGRVSVARDGTYNTGDPGEEVRPDGRVSLAGDGTYNTRDPGEEVWRTGGCL